MFLLSRNHLQKEDEIEKITLLNFLLYCTASFLVQGERLHIKIISYCIKLNKQSNGIRFLSLISKLSPLIISGLFLGLQMMSVTCNNSFNEFVSTEFSEFNTWWTTLDFSLFPYFHFSGSVGVEHINRGFFENVRFVFRFSLYIFKTLFDFIR